MSSLRGCRRRPDVRRPGGALLLVGVVLVGACGRTADSAAVAGAPGGQYVVPPSVLQAAPAPDGGIVLTGQGPGGAEVRLQAPDGAAFAAASADDGTWSITVPRSNQPRMFAMEGDDAGRILHADGALLLLPSPGPRAVIARPGFGSLVIGTGGPELRLQGLDLDGGGGAAVSGTAPPGAAVRFFVDHQLAGAGAADRAGRFTVLNLDPRAAPVAPGVHEFRVETARGAAKEARYAVTDAAPPPGQVFVAARAPGAWSVTWRIPGGGAQTSVIFDETKGAP